MTAEAPREKTIALVLYEGLTPLDIVGPLQVLVNLPPPYQTVVVAERVEPLMTDAGVRLIAQKSFDEVPSPFAIVVPGGVVATLRAMSDERLRRYVRSAAETADLVTSICTGALILASVGLLQGRDATTHWAFQKTLESYGARYQRKRWVEDGKFVTAAGVSAGIDFGLHLAARLTDEATARQIQLKLGYDPKPPLGRIDWNHLGLVPNAMRGAASLVGPVLTVWPKLLTSQGR